MRRINSFRRSFANNPNFPNPLRVLTVIGGFNYAPSKNEKTDLWSVREFHILKYLSEKLHFRYNVTEVDKSNTEFYETLYQNADIGIASLPIELKRFYQADVTASYHQVDIPFMIEKARDLPKFDSFTQPFSNPVWIAVLLVLMSSTVLSKWISSLKESLTKVFLSLFGCVLHQPLDMDVGSLAKVIWWSSWLWFSTIISLAYGSLYFSFLTVPVKEAQPRNFKELSDAVLNKKMICMNRPYINDFMHCSAKKSLKMACCMNLMRCLQQAKQQLGLTVAKILK